MAQRTETILDRIVEHKRGELAAAKSAVPLTAMRARAVAAPAVRDFAAVLTGMRIALIAEVKKASPSAGLIRRDFDPVAIAQVYERCGADAISVLTDEKYFQGRLEYIERIKQAVDLPVMRKDFIIDIWQVYESRAAGADAILLIAEALQPGRLMDLMIAAAELTLTVLLEVHQADTLLNVRSLTGFPRKGYSILGINNRDLTTMQVDLNTTSRLAELLDNTNELVAESGIKTSADVEKLMRVGVRAVLIGQTLCESPDIERRFTELFG